MSSRRSRQQRHLAAGTALALVPIAWAVGQVSAQGPDPGFAHAKQLYERSKCSICHALAGKGGRMAPPLDNMGKKWTANKMFLFLKAPSSVNPRSAMPPMRGTDDEIRTVSAYMMSLGGVPSVAPPEPSIAWGQQLFAQRQCFYCHRIGGKGGKVGPALDAENKGRTREFVINHFKNPAAVTPGSVMPPLAASEPELQSLAFYVESLKPGAAIPTITLPSPAEGGTAPSVVEGEALYHAVTCQSCHAIGGKGGYLGPALDNEGGTGRKTEWMIAHFQKPDEIAPGTTMPIVQGTDRQLKSLAMYVLSLNGKVAPSVELGKKTYTDRGCAACHGASGQGTKLGPGLTGGVTRTDAWVLDHFRDPAAVTPNSVMPRIWAADWETQSLVNYLKTIRQGALR